MYEGRINAAPLMLDAVAGFPPAIDEMAVQTRAPGFLRAAWYRAGAGNAGRTVLVRRGNGAVAAAIPTMPFGPVALGARKIAGSYWPFRAPLVADDLNPLELAQALGEPQARKALGALWRIGPARADDPVIRLFVKAARLAGWQVLVRPAGTAWLIDCDSARAEGWPRASTARRMARYERKLAETGAVRWQHVRGSDWDDAALTALGRIEADSWIARNTDGSGAKFLRPEQRRAWAEALSDPSIAAALCATILWLDDRPIAFSFDADDGAWRHGIAGSYAEDLRAFSIGKMANLRSVTDAIAAGQSVVDLGSGDSGYKRDMGAVAGYELVDLLFVRHPLVAKLIARWWESAGDAA